MPFQLRPSIPYACLRSVDSKSQVDMELHKDSYVLGRAAGCQIALDHSYISMIHCIITMKHAEDGTTVVKIKDQSRNGTWIRSQTGKRRLKQEQSEILSSRITIRLGSPYASDCIALEYQPIPSHSIHAAFKMGKAIGEGMFGEVRKARHRLNYQAFAVKALKREKYIAQNELAKILRQQLRIEVAIMKRAQHPNIVQLHYVFEEDSKIYLVMEFAPEGDLFGLICKRGGLRERDAKTVAGDLCSALSYLHAHNVVHRDIKPNNILVMSENPLRVKVADFGLAKVIPNHAFLQSYCGTLDYMAPEIRSEAPYDEKIDSWSVGVTTFAMIANALPFKKPKVQEQQIATAFVISWEVMSTRISMLGRDFIKRMLKVEPTSRLSVTAAAGHSWLKEVCVDTCHNFQKLNDGTDVTIEVLNPRLV